ncbi:restriction endonuclease subunit S [Tenacibaculum sp. 1B UA]|uniref:restriction endonuclease subunit S n=1 Tax=Tenacibaculum sp. 1B UA TaxID=2922252 RepID=UPI002A23997A|nr:restriction endonuclease subunit S [Tenacibaculum sp. 1B UA]MDX8554274.1 restriction endonuclease subunit S [Tenacibaculum sp. 1B UA]
MEEQTRNNMVDKSNLAYKFQEVEKEINYTYLPDKLKYTSVSLTEILNNKLRLEANAFNLEAKTAKEKVLNNKYGFINLWSKNGLVDNAFYPGRFKRIYVSKKEGKPFFLPSQMTEIKPKATKFISPKTYKTLNGIEIVKDNLLMSRSGTIGRCTISSKTNIGKLYSDDIIRVGFKNKYDLGYTYAFFQTTDGQLILQTNNYGAVVKHIEPEHLQSIIIPNAPEQLKREIHELVVTSYELRDESNDLIDEAEQILYKELQLKPIEELKTEYFDNSVELRNYTTKLSDLRLRFDGSFHIPIVKQVESALKLNAKELVKLSDLSLTNDIVLPGRFSRTYVDKENGVQFLGGRDLFQLSPTTEKYLSKVVHKKQIEGDLKISKNDILTPSRGTIGKVVLAPEHFSDKAISDNIINIRPTNENVAGYLFSILNSEYGSILIKRQIYGGVVDAMEPTMLSSIDIPLLKNERKQKEINDLVLKANELRYQAHLKEQEAIKKMEEIIDNKTSLHTKR